MNYIGVLWEKFLYQLGIWSTITSIIAIVSSTTEWGCYKWILLVAAILLSILISYCQVYCKRKKLSIAVNHRSNINISYGNIFEKEGVIVIPVNDYFDTHVGDGIIAPNTIHGKFIEKYFKNNTSELDAKIDAALSGTTGENNLNRQPCGLKIKKYPLGTCARIFHDNKIFILVVSSCFNENNHAVLNISEYPILIQQLYYHIEQYHENNPVYIPLIGSGMAGIDRTKMQLLNYMIAGAFYTDHLSISQGLNIILYPEDGNTLPDIHLNIIKYQFKNYKYGNL
jgi:hypothetical protein